MKTPITKQKVRTFDAELPFLASEAAFELDNYLVGKPASFGKTVVLLGYLQNSIEQHGQGAIRPLTDAASAAMMFDAMNDSDVSNEIFTKLDVISQAIADVPAGKRTAERHEFEKIRDFFIALSDRALSASNIYEAPTHPYRS